MHHGDADTAASAVPSAKRCSNSHSFSAGLSIPFERFARSSTATSDFSTTLLFEDIQLLSPEELLFSKAERLSKQIQERLLPRLKQQEMEILQLRNRATCLESEVPSKSFAAFHSRCRNLSRMLTAFEEAVVQSIVQSAVGELREHQIEECSKDDAAPPLIDKKGRRSWMSLRGFVDLHLYLYSPPATDSCTMADVLRRQWSAWVAAFQWKEMEYYHVKEVLYAWGAGWAYRLPCQAAVAASRGADAASSEVALPPPCRGSIPNFATRGAHELLVSSHHLCAAHLRGDVVEALEASLQWRFGAFFEKASRTVRERNASLLQPE